MFRKQIQHYTWANYVKSCSATTKCDTTGDEWVKTWNSCAFCSKLIQRMTIMRVGQNCINSYFYQFFGVRDGEKEECWYVWCSCPGFEAVYKWASVCAFEMMGNSFTVPLKIHRSDIIPKCNYLVTKMKHSKLVAIFGSWKNNRNDLENWEKFFSYPPETRRSAPRTMTSLSLRWIFQ